MAAYLIANVEVTDPAGYEKYMKQVPATIASYRGRCLMRGGAREVLEGDWVPDRLVILEFPSMVQLKDWYDSPEYRPLRQIRQQTTKSRLVAIEGF